MSYVVVVTAGGGDYLRAYGTFRQRDRAVDLADKINAELEAAENAEFEEWQTRQAAGEITYSFGNPEDMAPDGYGRARVLPIHKQGIRRILRFALGDLES